MTENAQDLLDDYVGDYKGLACLTIKVNPGASRNAILGCNASTIKIAISAPPEKGKANQELLTFLAKKLDIKKSGIQVIQGETSRNKVVAFISCSREMLKEKLKSLIPKTLF